MRPQPTKARSLSPSSSPTGNFTCSDFAATHGGGQQWLEVKFDTGELQSGTKDGVTLVWNGDNTFDFSSTMGIDAVFVKSGSQGSHLYVYAPTAQSSETFFDDGLTAPQAISHISFCFDDERDHHHGSPPPPPPPAATADDHHDDDRGHHDDDRGSHDDGARHDDHRAR